MPLVENFRKICCSFFGLSDQFILCCFLLAENSPIMDRNTGARESKRERERERDLLACWKFSNFGERDDGRERERELLACWNFSNFVERDEERERSAFLLEILQLWRKRWRETQWERARGKERAAFHSPILEREIAETERFVSLDVCISNKNFESNFFLCQFVIREFFIITLAADSITQNNFTTSDSSLNFIMQNCCWMWIQCHIYQLMMFVESGIWRTDNLPLIVHKIAQQTAERYRECTHTKEKPP